MDECKTVLSASLLNNTWNSFTFTPPYNVASLWSSKLYLLSRFTDIYALKHPYGSTVKCATVNVQQSMCNSQCATGGIHFYTCIIFMYCPVAVW